jgi:hypothetical protein
MRNITGNAVDAFMTNDNFNKQNTKVVLFKDDVELKLHGHTIAYKDGADVKVSFCGYPTNTTKERLNGLLARIGKDYRFVRRNFDLHVEGFDGWLMPIDDDKYLSLNMLDQDHQNYKDDNHVFHGTFNQADFA